MTPDPWDSNDGQTHSAEPCRNTQPHRSHEWGADEFHPDLGAWCPGMQPSSDTPEHVSGVAVHRAPIAEILGVFNYSANLNLDRPNVEQGTWHSLSADAQQARREAVIEAACESLYGVGSYPFNEATGFIVRHEAMQVADAVLAVLGLGGDS